MILMQQKSHQHAGTIMALRILVAVTISPPQRPGVDHGDDCWLILMVAVMTRWVGNGTQ